MPKPITDDELDALEARALKSADQARKGKGWDMSYSADRELRLITEVRKLREENRKLSGELEPYLKRDAYRKAALEGR